MSDSARSVSSPIATGGGGSFFEQHVGAYFLALLLTRGIPPLLKDCQVVEVHFQAEHLGWNTDDVFVVGDKGKDRRRKLAMQVKRNFQISRSQPVCKKAFADFWRDFNDTEKFDVENDRLALVTLRGTNVLLDKFGSLLDCARASTDGAGFARRLSTEGFLSKQARGQAEDIRFILQEVAERAVSADKFRQFLSVLHVISLDLSTQTAQQEAAIKNLLAFTSKAPDPIDSADATWRQLLQITGNSDGMPAAGSYKYENLPQDIRQCHSAIGTRPTGQIDQLIEHSLVTLNGIRTTIAGSVSVKREALEAQVFNSIESTQVTVVSGTAGKGKSAVTKGVIGSMASDYFCLAFRAGEFDASHIDQALTAIQKDLSADRLFKILSAQSRIVIFVDSVDRLLEASNRKAFADLLTLARENLGIRILLTCRDYSLNTVRVSLLEQAGIQHKVVEVDSFTDEELEQIVEKVPKIAPAVRNINLRKLLRAPYFLDIAARIKWSESETLPNSEQEFRLRCWQEIICAEAESVGGMSRVREQAFIQLSLSRAKELRPFVPCDSLNQNAIDALCKDSLLSLSDKSSLLAAPAHDVLEDWAILKWLDNQFAIHEWDAAIIAEGVSGYPALRRSYRKWLSEALVRETKQADEFILSVVAKDELPSYFRDDTLVCMLLSFSAEQFLSRNHRALLREENKLLVRIIFLLRTACKESPSWLSKERGLASQLLIPTGAAWVSVLGVVSEEIEHLLPKHLGTILGFVEDWARQVSYETPRPSGHCEAGAIITRLLRDLSGYNSKKMRQRALDVLIKIPGSVPDFFKELLQRSCTDDYQDTVAVDLRKLLLTEHSCAFACRDFPEEIIYLAKSFFCLPDESAEQILIRKNEHGWSPLNTDAHFGIEPHVESDFSIPASALRGPFWSLLVHSPHRGVDFIISLMNHACSWYGEQRWPARPLEPAWQIEVRIPGDEAPVKQWANERLYRMYRGTSIAPHVLESALMALERWLLQIAENEDVDIEAWLLKLIRESNNVAITGVVASVCLANRRKCGRAGLSLLSSADIFVLDRDRRIHEHSANFMPSFNLTDQIYEEERSQSAALSHRDSDIETFAINLQLTDNREQVWQVIDENRAALPAIQEQSEADKLWRLALHRIDIRGMDFRPSPPVSGGDSETEDSKQEEYVALVPKNLEPDIEEIVEQGTRHSSQSLEGLSLWAWGHSICRRESETTFEIWKDKLSLAKARMQEETNSSSTFPGSGSGFVAAIGVQDFWDEMGEGDRSWCIERMIEAIEKNSDSRDRTVMVSVGSLNPDGFSAYALPRIIQALGVGSIDDRLLATLSKALTHAVLEVRKYAAAGVGKYLGKTEPALVVLCAAALSMQAKLIEDLIALQETKPYDEQLQGHEIVQLTAVEARRNILAKDIDVELELSHLSPQSWYGRLAIRSILPMVENLVKPDLAINLHKQITFFLYKGWRSDRDNSDSHHHRDFQFDLWYEKQIAGFAISLKPKDAVSVYQNIIQAVQEHPGEVEKFVTWLILEVDRSEVGTSFWHIWQAFADQTIESEWVENLNTQRTTATRGVPLLERLFLGIDWNKNTRYWPQLDNQEYRIENFIKELPASTVSLTAYCRFLYWVGEKSLPDSFSFVAEQLRLANPSQSLQNLSAVYYLELLLRRFVYSQPLQLKQKPQVRKGVLYILDRLVDSGSAAAYQMRDDFVTPLST